MNCPADYICLVYPAWYVIVGMGFAFGIFIILIIVTWFTGRFGR